MTRSVRSAGSASRYRRRRGDGAPHEMLTIWINGACVGQLTVRVGAETELLDLVVYNLAGNGARDSVEKLRDEAGL